MLKLNTISEPLDFKIFWGRMPPDPPPPLQTHTSHACLPTPSLEQRLCHTCISISISITIISIITIFNIIICHIQTVFDHLLHL